MSLKDRIFNYYAPVTEKQARRLQHSGEWYTVELKPPRNQDLPASLPRFIKGILEIQTKWFGLKNVSPISSFEIRRTEPSQLRFQISTPTKRLERRVRAHLYEEIPGIEFAPGTSGLPINHLDTVGGGLLTTGRSDIYPLETDQNRPVMNNVATALHRHSMKNTGFVLQILYQPYAGHPVKNRLWIRKAYKRLGYLRKEKPDLYPWHDRPATSRERDQADAIEHKAGNPRFKTSIRILVINGREHTRSRVKEVGGAFQNLESETTGQYLDLHTVKSVTQSKIINFADAVNQRKFAGHSLSFQTSPRELATLLTLPSINQDNIQYAQNP